MAAAKLEDIGEQLKLFYFVASCLLPIFLPCLGNFLSFFSSNNKGRLQDVRSISKKDRFPEIEVTSAYA